MRCRIVHFRSSNLRHRYHGRQLSQGRAGISRAWPPRQDFGHPHQTAEQSVFRYTGRGNLVGVITNGTAVLGLGNIGALASKPVMEGKAVLFKKFAGLDVFDIEINETDPDKLVEIIAGLEATFGGINLEDIKAPECFTVERKLRERMKIPVFHDDQHGTAITVCAAVVNGLAVAGKRIEDVKLVTSGAGAAALACLDLLVDLGLPLEHIWVTDIEGVVYEGRKKLMDADKERFARKTKARTLAEVIEGADVFLGLSAGNVLKPEMVATMAANPLILALANPNPEILPEAAHAVRDDIVMATGRSDYPNQVNNVLCFPYIFRGALDVGATTITREMEKAAVLAIASLAREEQNEVVAAAYGTYDISFGRDYLIPKPFDPRLIVRIAPAVAKAAMEGGVATRPIADLDAYAEQLQQFVYHSGAFMKPLFSQAKQIVRDGGRARIVFTEGEDERVLRAVQVIVDEKVAKPILVGRPQVLLSRIEKFGLRLRLGQDVEVCNPEYDERFHQYWTTYWDMMCRNGITKEMARVEMRRRLTLIGAMMVHLGDADGMICGAVSGFHDHLRFIDGAPGRRRRHDLRRGQRLPRPPALHRRGHRQEARRADLRGDEHPAAQRAHRGAGGHARQRRPQRRADRRIHRGGRRGNAAPEPGAQGGAAVALEFRHRQLGLWRQDAPRAGTGTRARARAGDRRRDARRLRVGRGAAPAHPAVVHAQGGGQPAGVPQRGLRQHRLQPAQDDRRRQRRGGAVPAGRQRGGAYPDVELDGAPHRQHGRHGRGQCRRGPLSAARAGRGTPAR
ncbi:malic enzyme, NAD-binding domain protein [Bordetella pertussis STO1-CHOC-0018]|nr:malic enzyme, NAD-binding domain protein [Bordetella pertussis STO1-CHOC-0018]